MRDPASAPGACGLATGPQPRLTISGGLWFAAWLFTIGYLKLSFLQGAIAIIIWPYYLGAHFSVF